MARSTKTTPVKLKLNVSRKPGDQQDMKGQRERGNEGPRIPSNTGTIRGKTQAVSREAATYTAQRPQDNMAAPVDCEALLEQIAQLKRKYNQNVTLKESTESWPKFTPKQKQPAQRRKNSGVKEPFPEFDPRVTTFDNTAHGQEEFNITTGTIRTNNYNNSIDTHSGAFENVMGEMVPHHLDFSMNRESGLSVDMFQPPNSFSNDQTNADYHFGPMPNHLAIQDNSTQSTSLRDMNGDMNVEPHEPLNYSSYQHAQYPAAYQTGHTQDHSFSSPLLESRHHVNHPVYGVTHLANPHSSTSYSEYVPHQHILPSFPPAAVSQYRPNGYNPPSPAPAQQYQASPNQVPTPELATAARKRTLSQSNPNTPSPRNSKLSKASAPTTAGPLLPRRTSNAPAPRRRTTLTPKTQALKSSVSDLPEPIWPSAPPRRTSSASSQPRSTSQGQNQYSLNPSTHRRQQSLIPHRPLLPTFEAEADSIPLSRFLSNELSQASTTRSPESSTQPQLLRLPHTEIEKGLKQLDVAHYIDNVAAISPPADYDVDDCMANLLSAQYSLRLLQTSDYADTASAQPSSPTPLFAPLDGSHMSVAEAGAEVGAETQGNERNTNTQEAKDLVQRMVKAMILGIDGLVRAAEEELVEKGEEGEGGFSGVKKVMEETFGKIGGVLGFAGVGGVGSVGGHEGEGGGEIGGMGGFERLGMGSWDEGM